MLCKAAFFRATKSSVQGFRATEIEISFNPELMPSEITYTLIYTLIYTLNELKYQKSTYKSFTIDINRNDAKAVLSTLEDVEYVPSPSQDINYESTFTFSPYTIKLISQTE